MRWFQQGKGWKGKSSERRTKELCILFVLNLKLCADYCGGHQVPKATNSHSCHAEYSLSGVDNSRGCGFELGSLHSHAGLV